MMSRVDAQANINPRSSFINHVVLKKEQNGIDVIYDASYGRRCEKEEEWESLSAIKGYGFILAGKYFDIDMNPKTTWIMYLSQENNPDLVELIFSKQ